MGPPLDIGMPGSLTQRRQAASHLPAFELPPPSNLQFAAQHYGHKFPPLSGISHTQAPPVTVSVGNLLTPPSNSASESGASSANLGPGITPNGQTMPVLPYTPTFWQSGAPAPHPWQNNHQFQTRSVFSPLSGHLKQSDPHSPSINSNLPPPPYDISGVQPFQNGVPLASPISATHPSAPPSLMAPSMMQGHVRPPSAASPVSPGDSMSKPGSAPSIFATMGQSATPQQSYSYQSSTPVSQSPHPASAPASAISPPLHHGQIPQLQTQSNHFIKPPFPSYSLPAMPGPVLTNVNSPGAQMSMVGNMQAQMLPMAFHSGYAANPGMHYAQHRSNSPQQPANQDRPFKCDECPQSFNRNHDLKRHKRIHLAVKPFPCNHCDKSFSRKDALKRHILVKGCGKAGGDPDGSSGDGVKSESESETQDTSVMSVTA